MDLSRLWFTKLVLVKGKRLAAAIGCRAKLRQQGLPACNLALSLGRRRDPIKNL